MRELVWSIVEGQQLSPIFAGFRDYEPRRVVKRLMEKGLQGALDPSDETSNTNEGRNILFELLLGAQFHRARLNATIGGKANLRSATTSATNTRITALICSMRATVGGQNGNSG